MSLEKWKHTEVHSEQRKMTKSGIEYSRPYTVAQLLIDKIDAIMGIPYYGGFLFLIKKLQNKSQIESVYYLLRDQSTLRGQISNRSAEQRR